MTNIFNDIYDWRTIVISISVLFSSALPADQKPYAPESIQGVNIVSAEETIEMILANPDLIVIDSRKKTEFQKGHIEGAVNILNTSLKPKDLEDILQDKSREILFYCNGVRCLRSSDSIVKAKDWGYSNLFWFRGGWNEWVEKRLPVVID